MDIKISNFTNIKYQNLLRDLGLTEPRSIEVSITPNKVITSEFVWPSGNESQHMDMCIAWLRSVVTIPGGKQLYSVAGQSELLNYDFESYSLRGTTDLVFISNAYVKTYNVRAGIEIAVELKKEVSSLDFKQATLELVAAGISSHFPVVVLLTDLRKSWQFSWFAKSGIQRSSLQCSEAVAFIEEILNESRNNPVHGRLTMTEYLKGRDGIESSSAPHMTDQEVVDELLSGKRTDPYDLIAKPEVGNMEEFFDEMTEAEITRYKLNHVVKALPPWMQMYA